MLSLNGPWIGLLWPLVTVAYEAVETSSRKIANEAFDILQSRPIGNRIGNARLVCLKVWESDAEDISWLQVAKNMKLEVVLW